MATPGTHDAQRPCEAPPASAPPAWTVWWLAARPKTLTAGAVPVLVGLAVAPPADWTGVGVAVLTLLAALAIQVAVNFANDCFDAESGIDTEARLGPTRAVQAGLVSAAAMRRAFAVMVALAVALGLPLVLRGGLPILATGVVSLACAWAYAGGPRPLASLALGDAFVFAFFGVVPVLGTAWLQQGRVGMEALLASIPVALLAVAILVVNNLRDIPTDEPAGKRTLAVRLGERATRLQYRLCVATAVAWPLLLVPHYGAAVLVALLAAPPAWNAAANLQQRSGRALNESLAETARLQLLQGLLLAGGIAASRLLA